MGVASCRGIFLLSDVVSNHAFVSLRFLVRDLDLIRGKRVCVVGFRPSLQPSPWRPLPLCARPHPPSLSFSFPAQQLPSPSLPSPLALGGIMVSSCHRSTSPQVSSPSLPLPSPLPLSSLPRAPPARCPPGHAPPPGPWWRPALGAPLPDTAPCTQPVLGARSV
jgi:hypothetical protein